MVQEHAPPWGWWGSNVRREADRERLRVGERLGNVIGIFFVIAVALVFWDVQSRDQGFFTSAFGPVEQLAFYGSLLLGAAPMVVRAVLGRRNLGRLMDVVNSVGFMAAWSYLLSVFPFDFPRLWEYLPDALGAALSWVDNDLVRLVMTLAIVVTAISTVYNMVIYWEVRRELRSRGAAAPL